MKIIKNSSAIFIIINCFLLLLLGGYLPGIVTSPILAIHLEKEDNWTITQCNPSGEGYRLGIREGDIVLLIDNADPGEFPSVKAWKEIERASTIDISRDGNSLKIYIEKHSLIEIFVTDLFEIFIGFFFVAMGFFAVYKQPYSLSAGELFRLNWLIGVLFILAPASSRGMFLARELLLITFSLVPFFLIRFLSFFIKDKNSKFSKFSMAFLLFLPAFLSIILLLEWGGFPISTEAFRTIALINGILGFLLALVYLIYTLRMPANPIKKNQLLIIMTGLIIGLLPFMLFNALPLSLTNQSLPDPRLTEFFVIFSSISMLYATSNQYLPDAHKILRTLICLLVSAAIINIFIVCIWPDRETYSSNIHLYFSLLIFSIFIVPLSYILTMVLEKAWNVLSMFFHAEIRNEPKSYADSLKVENEENVLESLSDKLDLEGVFVIIEKEDEPLRKEAVGQFYNNLEAQKILESYYFKKKCTSKSMAGLILPHDYPAETFLFYAFSSYQCGIFLGYKHSHIRFKVAGMPLLKIVGYQIFHRLIIGDTLEFTQSKLSQMNEMIAKAQQQNHLAFIIKRRLLNNIEKEKELIAREIHDGPLQASYYLNRRLDKYKRDGINQADTISQIQELVYDIIYELREICRTLRPPSFVGFKLVPALESFIAEIMRTEIITISLEVYEITREQCFGKEVELAVYRFFQEGIRNVIKHAGSQRAEIILSYANQKLKVEIKDFGQGFDTHIISENLAENDKFGIIGMRERIESLGGNFSVDSTPGKGTTFRGILPID